MQGPPAYMYAQLFEASVCVLRWPYTVSTPLGEILEDIRMKSGRGEIVEFFWKSYGCPRPPVGESSPKLWDMHIKTMQFKERILLPEKKLRTSLSAVLWL